MYEAAPGAFSRACYHRSHIHPENRTVAKLEAADPQSFSRRALFTLDISQGTIDADNNDDTRIGPGRRSVLRASGMGALAIGAFAAAGGILSTPKPAEAARINDFAI